MDQAAREAIRQRRLTVGCLLGCGALAAGVAVAAVAAVLWLIPIPPDLTRLEGEGAQIADRVEAYRAARGAYPPDLDAAGANPRTGRYGGWQYEVYPDGTGFRLSIGRYGEDGFALSYTSEGGWYSDT
jgi:hypothetical protein